MAFFSGLRNRYLGQLDPAQLAMAHALIGEDDEVAGEMAQRFRALRDEHQRLRSWGPRLRRDAPELDDAPASAGQPEDSMEAIEPANASVNDLAFAQTPDGFPPRYSHGPLSRGYPLRKPRFRRLDDPLYQAKLRRGGGLNGAGYIPTAADRELLARIIYAESFNTPEDDVAIGWTTVNRIGQPEFRDSLEGVLRQRDQFQIVSEGNRGRGDSQHWIDSARPNNLSPAQRARLARAQVIADGILSGSIADPTGQALYFHASLDPAHPRREAPWFQTALDAGTIEPSSYSSRAPGQRRNYFYVPAKPERR